MNVVKVYLKEVHEEKPYTTEWLQFSDKEFVKVTKEFVKVTATWISFGVEDKKTIVFNAELWKQIKEQGFWVTNNLIISRRREEKWKWRCLLKAKKCGLDLKWE